jgi:hypothetical protein
MVGEERFYYPVQEFFRNILCAYGFKKSCNSRMFPQTPPEKVVRSSQPKMIKDKS